MTLPADRWQDPSDLIHDLGIRTPAEIHVEAIAQFCGATVVYDRLHGCEASLVGRGDRAIITVNREAPRERQRFSAAHELAHWILDRGESGFAKLDPWDEVDWWDEEGNEIEITTEQRANEWACELLLPSPMFGSELNGIVPVTFDKVRELAARYRTDLTTTAKRFVHCVTETAMLVSSRSGQPSKSLRCNDISLDFWLREHPGTGTVAHGLLNGSRETPGSTEVPLDGWVDRGCAWWYTVHEDSIALPEGEVLSLLWWTGDGYETIVEFQEEMPLASEPGPEAVSQLVAGLERELGYRRDSGAPGETVLVNDEPSPHRIVIPDPAELDAEGMRRLVDEVARHQDAHRDYIVDSVVGWEPTARRYGWPP